MYRKVNYKLNFFLLIYAMIFSFFSCVSSNESLPDSEVTTNPSNEITVTTEDTKNLDGKKLTVVNSEQPIESNQQTISPLEKYKNKTKNILISPLSSPSEIMKGKTFDSLFTFGLTDSNNMPLENLSVTISYPSFSANGIVSFATEELMTDSRGTVSFKAPLIEFACDDFVSCYITPELMDDEVANYIQKTATKIPFKVHTDKIWNVFSVSILDYTEAGTPITSNSLTSSAILQEMYTKHLSVGNSDWVSEIDSDDNILLYKHAKSLFGNTIGYLIHGKLTYLEGVTTNENGNKTVKLNVSYGVMDMKTGEDVLTDSFDVTGEDSSEWKLFDSIRHNIIAPKIVNAIYYGL
ncbi:MAG: hypothetical protein BKP49_01955 [Treponema sp. CETP13]|nr:MAG: hypothetical protein BKP49_01955 [Treponema sp. CETP13]